MLAFLKLDSWEEAEKRCIRIAHNNLPVRNDIGDLAKIFLPLIRLEKLFENQSGSELEYCKHFEDSVESAYNYFRKRKGYYPVEMLLVDFFRQILKILPKTDELPVLFQALIDQLQKLSDENEMPSAQVFQLFDFLKWAREKRLALEKPLRLSA